MTSIGIIGSKGRMGAAIGVAAQAAGLTLAGAIDRGGDPVALARISDVLIDFSAPAALAANLGAAVAAGKPVLVGTTGLDEDHHRHIDDTAHHVAVLQTGNTSFGVAVLAYLVREAAARLGDAWDIDIVEMHHRMKIDAPSGTALLLGKAAESARDRVPMGPGGNANKRPTDHRTGGTIGYASIRGGTVAGDHIVIFAGDHERIELTHRAEDRGIFARGAIRAAQWLIGKPAGRYTIEDMFGR